jgi:hypothetical protein
MIAIDHTLPVPLLLCNAVFRCSCTDGTDIHNVILVCNSSNSRDMAQLLAQIVDVLRSGWQELPSLTADGLSKMSNVVLLHRPARPSNHGPGDTNARLLAASCTNPAG